MKTGHLFEKRLILKYLQSDNKCPITGEELKAEDLISLQVNKSVKPRPLSATGIPGLINLFQNEWDDLMLETFTLKQHLDSTRQQLSQALYQHDAACRVIARLIRERDELKTQLVLFKQQVAEAAAAMPLPEPIPPPAAMEIEEEKKEEGITDVVLNQMTKKWKQLSKERKKRGPPDTLEISENISVWDAVSSFTVHKSDKPGVLCLDLHPSNNELILTGGVDRDAILFNHASGQVVATLSGHSKKVRACCFHPFSEREILFTASSDKTTKIWGPHEDQYRCRATLSDHTGEVVGVSIHATGDYMATASLDRTWAFYSIIPGGDPACLKVVKDPAVTGGFECVSFHPDGLILGTGTSDALIRIWDMKTQTNVASFEGHTGLVNDIAFSENGYYMASAGEDGSVRMWDLRRLKNFYNIETGDSGAVNCIAFDHSGSYLACGSNDVRLFVVKEWTQLTTITAHRAAVTSLKFGNDAKFLATTSMDRSMKFFGSV